MFVCRYLCARRDIHRKAGMEYGPQEVGMRRSVASALGWRIQTPSYHQTRRNLQRGCGLCSAFSGADLFFSPLWPPRHLLYCSFQEALVFIWCLSTVPPHPWPAVCSSRVPCTGHMLCFCLRELQVTITGPPFLLAALVTSEKEVY